MTDNDGGGSLADLVQATAVQIIMIQLGRFNPFFSRFVAIRLNLNRILHEYDLKS